jgi:hypothetical protein
VCHGVRVRDGRPRGQAALVRRHKSFSNRARRESHRRSPRGRPRSAPRPCRHRRRAERYITRPAPEWDGRNRYTINARGAISVTRSSATWRSGAPGPPKHGRLPCSRTGGEHVRKRMTKHGETGTSLRPGGGLLANGASRTRTGDLLGAISTNRSYVGHRALLSRVLGPRMTQDPLSSVARTVDRDSRQISSSTRCHLAYGSWRTGQAAGLWFVLPHANAGDEQTVKPFA